ncbi:MAG: hypothetical protein D6820_14270 [Lentisphaerae bacterium]|nr:MAG: hypothetical protein D6820_14270 [Lentisphaerota bacterium]
MKVGNSQRIDNPTTIMVKPVMNTDRKNVRAMDIPLIKDAGILFLPVFSNHFDDVKNIRSLSAVARRGEEKFGGRWLCISLS